MKTELLLPLLLLLTNCSKITSDKLTTADSVVIATDSLSLLSNNSPLGDTIVQRLEFEVSNDKFDFEIKYVVKEPHGNTSSYQMEMIEFKLLDLQSPFSKVMTDRLKESFSLFYNIPKKDFSNALLSKISAKHISEFLIIKDYNLDGILDIGISDTPTGNNVFEDIYVKVNNQFIFWKGLSGRPIWKVNKDERIITTGWHMSADIHSISTLQVTGDTILTEISREETEELDEEKIIMKTYKFAVLTKVDTLERNPG